MARVCAATLRWLLELGPRCKVASLCFSKLGRQRSGLGRSDSGPNANRHGLAATPEVCTVATAPHAKINQTNSATRFLPHGVEKNCTATLSWLLELEPRCEVASLWVSKLGRQRGGLGRGDSGSSANRHGLAAVPEVCTVATAPHAKINQTNSATLFLPHGMENVCTATLSWLLELGPRCAVASLWLSKLGRQRGGLGRGGSGSSANRHGLAAMPEVCTVAAAPNAKINQTSSATLFPPHGTENVCTATLSWPLELERPWAGADRQVFTIVRVARLGLNPGGHTSRQP
jgi:hypothetical protein